MTTHAVYSLNSSSATKITPNGVHSELNVSIQNVSASGYVYIGGEGVTTSNYGFRILPDSAISFELEGHDELYALSASAGMYAAVITTSLAET
jgi:hypothetical protein